MNKNLTGILLFLIFLSIYFWGSFARIPFADCVGFVLTVEQGEWMTTATATSHFLYVNTAILIKDIFGLNGIEANRILVLLSAALSVVFVYLSVLSLKANTLTSAIAAAVFGLSFSFWRNAEIPEVYTYNCLWISLFFLSVIRSFCTEKKIYIILSGLFLGISLWLHIQNVLLIPGFFVFLYYMRNEKKEAFLSLALFSALFAALFVLNYFQGLQLNSPYSSDQGHWVEDSFKKTLPQYLGDLVKSVFYIIYNYTVFIFFGVVGIFTLYRNNKEMFFVFLFSSFFVYGFSTFYAVTDNYVFFLPFNIVFAIAIGYGMMHRQKIFRKTYFAVILIPLFYVFSYFILGHVEKAKTFGDFKSYKGGLAYYLLPWMNDNKGILEFVIDKKTAPEAVNWMTISAEEYAELLRSKGFSDQEIREF
ncbi:hypothetical protein ASG31_15415 [Chryseobacterium sp. Leaf404]|uniref:ArnT family glycosyltransferase n=1 Tax=unclassified Chryseobacterium TaxID=2593645 RepID=UPI0006FE4850|nr:MULTISPECIES: DUF2723 domain-containing protein [unclassified Chryseobacterium]KQT15314.1 hypothetical protein ASG31_15415 [Chryseobacterium sp. Leaf404]